MTLIALSVGLLHAQEYRGLILGRVTDPSGAVIPNAAVTAVGPQQTYNAKTNISGDFTIPFVQPGTYEVTAEATGFTKLVQKNVVISVAQKINVNFTLQVGTSSETVTVVAEAVGVNTVDASGGTTLDNQKVQYLPLNGRQMYMLLPLMPGVRFTTTTFGPGGNSGTRGWDETNAYTINGVSMYNQFTLNGAPITQQTSTNSGAWFISPNVDAVQEFKVMTNNYDASYGRAGGGTINTVLKSGTNAYHGTLFDFWRNTVLEANTYQRKQIGQPRLPHNQNQLGGTFGGPVNIPGVYNGKNKTFFFVSLEGWREVMPSGSITSAPSASVRLRPDGSVDLTAYLADRGITNGIYDPLSVHCATPGQNPCTAGWVRDQFQNNIIPANRISALGKKILSLYPMPNIAGSGEVNNYNITTSARYQYNQPIARMDHNFSEATRMYALFTWWSGTEFRPSSGTYMDPAIMTGNINNYRSTVTGVLDVTHTFSPTLFFDTRIAYTRAYNVSPNGGVSAGLAKLTAADLGLTMPLLSTSRNWAPSFSVSGYNNIIGNTKSPQMYESFDLSPTFNQTFGRHNLKYGVQAMLMRSIPCCGAGNANGSFSFGSGWTQKNPSKSSKDGAGIATLLLGYPTGGSVDWNETVYETYPYYAAYIQDDFKVKSNLTINLGLRWDVELSPRDRYNRLNAGFCFTCESPINSSVDPTTGETLAQKFARLFPGGLLPNGQQVVSKQMGGFRFSSDKLAPYDTHWKQWQPRVGIAWGFNPKTVLRAGIGISYTFARELGGSTTFTQNTGYVTTCYDPATNAPLPCMDFPNGKPYPNGIQRPAGNSQGLLSGIGNGQSFDQRTRRIPYVYQFSLGFQRELAKQIVLDMSYVGSLTKDLRLYYEHDSLPSDQVLKGAATEVSGYSDYLDRQVPNPFYNILPKSSGMGSSPTVSQYKLMVPYPAWDAGLGEYTMPKGGQYYHSLQVKLEKKVTGSSVLIRGLSFLTSFTYSRSMTSGYLNAWTLQDQTPVYSVAGSDRPLDFSFAGVWGLPIGKGGLIASDAKGVLGHIINGWSVDWVFTDAAGTPGSIPTGYWFNCPSHNSYAVPNRTWGEWVYNEDPSCFTPMKNWDAYYWPGRVSYIRNPWAAQLQLAAGKEFALKEGLNLQFKAEAFNATNTPIFGGYSTGSPDIGPRLTTNPIILAGNPNAPGYKTGYGTVGPNQGNFPRQYQLSLKMIF